MRVLIHGLNFAPELTGIGKYTGEIARYLAATGHSVRIVTAPPYYPQWEVGGGYSIWRYGREDWHGVEVIRCPLYVPNRPTPLKRVLHLTSFALSSSLPVLAQALWRPDVVLCIAPAILSAPVGLLCARATRAKAWLHIQDFEIDAATSLGMLPASAGAQTIPNSLLGLLVRRFDRVSTISRSMREKLIAMGVPSDKAMLLPNWVDTRTVFPLPRPASMRARLRISDDEVVVLYSGNIGMKQGLEVVVEAAKLLEASDRIHFFICGDGAARRQLERDAGSLHNLHFLPLQPASQLNELLSFADIHVLPQRNTVAGAVMPSKLAGMLASGKPVIATAMRGSELERVVGGVGVVVPPGDPESLALAIKELAKDLRKRAELGAKGREFVVEHWDRRQVLSRFLLQLEDLSRE